LIHRDPEEKEQSSTLRIIKKEKCSIGT